MVLSSTRRSVRAIRKTPNTLREPKRQEPAQALEPDFENPPGFGLLLSGRSRDRQRTKKLSLKEFLALQGAWICSFRRKNPSFLRKFLVFGQISLARTAEVCRNEALG
jgi:hypothetical protein